MLFQVVKSNCEPTRINNYAILLLWFAVLVCAHDCLYRLHSRWFRLSIETFDAIHYAGLAVYKIGVIQLNLVPLSAL